MNIATEHSRSSTKLLSLSFTCVSLFVYSLFTYQGLQVDDKTEVFLGKFTFDVEKSEIQTFHLQVCFSLGVRVLMGWDSEGRLGRREPLGEWTWHDPFVSPE